MPRPPRPAAAIVTAEELVKHGKRHHAREELMKVLTGRRQRQEWSLDHERAALMCVGICIELQKGQEAKDVLHKYRNMTGEKAKESFEKVLTFYIEECERRYKQAERSCEGADGETKEDAEQGGEEPKKQDQEGGEDDDTPRKEGKRETEELEDLEEMETPESVLMAAITKLGSAERTHRRVAAPWLRFLWEAFRNVLDVLRNNVHYELLYYRTAKQAMDFCRKYNRRNEFKRLCNTLRNHLRQSHTWKSDTNIKLRSQETFERHVNLRLTAVKFARDLNLWKEAYRVTKDVAELIKEIRPYCEPRVRTSVNFLRLIAQLFVQSRDFAFHAAACQQIFKLCHENMEEFDDAEVESAVNSVVLSALAVPIAKNDSSVKDANAYTAREYQARREGEFKGLLNLQTVPSRQTLIQFVVESDVLPLAHEDVRKLFNLLEREFSPDALRDQALKMVELFTKSEGEFSKRKYQAYRDVLEYAITMRLLTQLSYVYTTMTLKKLAEWLPFCKSYSRLELHIANAVKAGVLHVRFSHIDECIKFTTGSSSASIHRSSGAGLESLRARMSQNPLSTLAGRLHVVGHMIAPEAPAEPLVGNLPEATKRARQNMQDRQDAQLKRRMANKQRKQKDQERLREKQLKSDHEATKQRREREKQLEQERERRLVEKEQREQQLQEVREQLDLYMAREDGRKAFANYKRAELEQKTLEELWQILTEHQRKAQRERDEKLENLQKHEDYLERSRRLAEIPKRRKAIAQELEERKAKMEERREKEHKRQMAEHSSKLALKERLSKLRRPTEAFIEKIVGPRREAFQKRLAQFEQQFRKQEERKRREEERARREWEKSEEYKEMKRREQEEEERRIQEEQELQEKQRLIEQVAHQQEGITDTTRFVQDEAGNEDEWEVVGASKSKRGGRQQPPPQREQEQEQQPPPQPQREQAPVRQQPAREAQPPASSAPSSGTYVPPARGAAPPPAVAPPRAERITPPASGTREMSKGPSPSGAFSRADGSEDRATRSRGAAWGPREDRGDRDRDRGGGRAAWGRRDQDRDHQKPGPRPAARPGGAWR